MIQSLYTGMHGLLAQQRNIDTIGNNVANIGTTGYKKSRLDFRDALYQKMLSPTENGPEVNLQRGAGVIPYQSLRDFAQGARMETGRNLDVSLETQGFFAVRSPNGDVQYTRNGAFYVSVEATGDFLVDAKGNRVLDSVGNPVVLQGTAADMVIGQTGAITFTAAGGDNVSAPNGLGVVDFDNRSGLTDLGDGYYAASDNAGAPAVKTDAIVKQGGLEASNVDYAEESVRLIRSQRAYQLASRCVTTADQMAQICNSIRG